MTSPQQPQQPAGRSRPVKSVSEVAAVSLRPTAPAAFDAAPAAAAPADSAALPAAPMPPLIVLVNEPPSFSHSGCGCSWIGALLSADIGARHSLARVAQHWAGTKRLTVTSTGNGLVLL